jgi:hypothetical protein
MLHKIYDSKGEVEKKFWSWVSGGLAPRRTDFAVPKATLTLTLTELSQLRVAVVRSKKLVAEAGDSSGT